MGEEKPAFVMVLATYNDLWVMISSQRERVYLVTPRPVGEGRG